MTMDRWGDSTHKMSAYNNRYHPSNRDQRQIDRMERETIGALPNSTTQSGPAQREVLDFLVEEECSPEVQEASKA